jgi:predicted anti-sigma-YlaC factor YlaD
MHRVIQDHLEEVLTASQLERCHSQVVAHVSECEECRVELEAMREQALLLRELRAQVEPRPGFYARVMERIEAQGAGSIWDMFFESAFGRRLAVASMALALLLGVYLVTSEQFPAQNEAQNISVTNPAVQFNTGALPGEDQPGAVTHDGGG